MINFAEYYLSEKTLNFTDDKSESKEDFFCMGVGQKLADRFDLVFNGWWEYKYTFTIPEGVPNARNTILAGNESEIIEKFKERFPEYLDYIMKKKFPNGYKPDSNIPSEPPTECEPLDLNTIRKD